MRSMCNPVFLGRVLRMYLSELDRLHRLSPEKLAVFRDQCFRYVCCQAMKTPVYRKLYEGRGVNLGLVQGLPDIKRVPCVGKDVLKDAYPQGLIPEGVDRSDLIEVATSGTTGKSLALYVDLIEVVRGLFGYLRMVHEYGLSWWRDRLAIIGDFAAHTAESGYVSRGLQPQLSIPWLFRGIRWLDTNDTPVQIMRSLERFQPDFIGGYVGMLGHLALLKEAGYGKQVNPKCIAATGSVLHPSLKTFIEDVFDTHVFEVYGATESGPIAFECPCGRMHVLSDYVHLEVLREGEPVEPGVPGHVVLTKLYTGGTPVVRYTAINDIVVPLYASCECGMAGEVIDRVLGRDDLCVYLPGGRVVLAAGINEVFSRVLYELKSRLIEDVEIVQPAVDRVTVGVVLADADSVGGPSKKTVLQFLKRGFEEKFGSGVAVQVTEIYRVKKGVPRIRSQVDPDSFEFLRYE